MNFAFAPEEEAFLDDFRGFLAKEKCRPDADIIFAPWRETDSWLVDSPERRAFMKRLADAGYIGMSWDKEFGGREMPGVYDYLLNEQLSSDGAPIIGKGVGCIGCNTNGCSKQNRPSKAQNAGNNSSRSHH